MVRIDRQVERLARRKDELARENAVLRGENARLRGRAAELCRERDILEKRVKRGTLRVETALSRLNLIAEDN